MRLLLLSVCAPAAFSLGVWDARRWHLSLDIGREAGTTMREDWAASGARLGLPIDVEVAGDAAVERDEDVGRASRLRPLEAPTLVNDEGLQTVAVKEGGWHLEQGSKLRFWLDVEEDARRADVGVPRGTRPPRNGDAEATLPPRRRLGARRGSTAGRAARRPLLL